MSKLLEQVKEIQRKAHVCPECRGAKKVETHPYGWLMPCDECDGKGQVDAPDIDTLVEVIEALAEFVECERELALLTDSEAHGETSGNFWKLHDLRQKKQRKRYLAVDLVENGLPEGDIGIARRERETGNDCI